MPINLGFKQKRASNDRLPPGQYETKDFPVLSLGPTPKISKESYSLEIKGLVEKPLTLSFNQLLKLKNETITKDIHCVTHWSKFDSIWSGVPFEEILKQIKPKKEATYILAHSYDGYSTNIPLEDLKSKQAWIAFTYDNQDIPSEHGGPVRLLIPHLYFWKSAKWLNKIEFIPADHPGFWEVRGYHNYGNPWKEQRYTND
ncbi:MAG TPA: sulfite oxidase-like oxidoreductase [Candidatus Nanoarchaeia archaeon]|nr:sulfite oxidase-like oxidoreductase [Candidatus Nanoarchaeia archaeon]